MRQLLGIASTLATLAVALLLSGCGSTSGSFLATALGITVDWPALANSRSVNGPLASLSAVFVLKEGSAGGHDLVLTINRDVGDQGGTRRYTTTTPAKAGTWSYNMSFYDQAGGQGDVVATVSGTMTVYGNGTTTLDDTTITPAGTDFVDKVVVDIRQIVRIGQTTTLTFKAYRLVNDNFVLIALPPHSGIFQLVNSSDSGFVTIAGDQATGLKYGTTNNGIAVTVTVNGDTGNPVTSDSESLILQAD
jgi:hypothetical protein